MNAKRRIAYLEQRLRECITRIESLKRQRALLFDRCRLLLKERGDTSRTCGWCHKALPPGAPSLGGKSHGICPTCAADLKEQLKHLKIDA